MQNDVDVILKNAHVLTMNEERQQFEIGAVAIKGESIVAVGPEDIIIQEYHSKEIIDCQGKILMPGLINAHTHVPMSLMRGLADDLRLDVWLQGYIWPVEREFVTDDFVKLGTQLSCAELIRSGVTCFADMYFYEETVAQATAAAGLRAVCSQTVVKFPSPDALSFEESLEIARDYIIRWKNHPLILPSIAPHAPYTCTPEILQAATKLAMEYDVVLHTHIAETSLEVETMRRESGMPVVPFLKKLGLFESKVLAAHCVHIDEGEMRSLLHAGSGIAHNPSSNLKLASGFAPVPKMLEVGLSVGIGTDGPASNNDLDMFEEIRLAAFVAKAVSNDPTSMPAYQAMEMATRLGANALHMGQVTGSIEPGKRADLILVDLNALHNSPFFRRDLGNIYAQLVYTCKASDVSDVMVNGNWLMRKHVLQTLNEEDLINAAREYAQRIDIFLMKREQSVFSKLVALGGSAEEESFEVQVKVKLDKSVSISNLLKQNGFTIMRYSHYHQHDIYFSFEDVTQGWLRYREDEIIDTNERVTGVRARLTLIGPTREGDFKDDVLLSRIRFFAPATNSPRFYREYFKPAYEVHIDKDRHRWLVRYKGEDFFVNYDDLEEPALGYYLEIKSRTWSRRDAEVKAACASEMILLLGGALEKTVTADYIEIVEAEIKKRGK